MEKYLVIIILFVLAYYLFNCWFENKINNILKTKEGFAGETSGVGGTNNADIASSINTLAQITKDLQTNGLTVPGALNIKGTLNTDGNITTKGNINIDGAINSNGAITTKGNLSTDSSITANKNVTVNGMLSVSSSGDDKIQNPTNNLRINNRGIQFGGVNNGRETNSAQITAGLHADNSLCIVGMSIGKDWNTRKVTTWAEGGFKVTGNLIVNGRNILKEIDEIEKNIIFNGSKMNFRPEGKVKQNECSNLFHWEHDCGSGYAKITIEKLKKN